MGGVFQGLIAGKPAPTGSAVHADHCGSWLASDEALESSIKKPRKAEACGAKRSV